MAPFALPAADMGDTIRKFLRDWTTDFRVATALLTRWPVAAPEAGDAVAMSRAARAFPLVGAMIGVAGGLVFAVAAFIELPALAGAFLAIAATILLTGAFHEDGLADTIDGFGGGRDKEHKLAILRDSQVGSYGVLALILSIGLRIAALAALGPWPAVAALAAAHAGGRAALPFVMKSLPPARPDGLAVAVGAPSQTDAAIAVGIAVVMLLVLLGFGAGLIALAAGGLAVSLAMSIARKQIGGYTGDVLGFVEQLVETSVLLTAAALL